MRPKLLERFTGHVTDIDDTTFFLICREQNEQLEIPLNTLSRTARAKLFEGTYAYLLVYENRLSFRFTRVKRWTKAGWREHLRRTRRWVKKHWDF